MLVNELKHQKIAYVYTRRSQKVSSGLMLYFVDITYPDERNIAKLTDLGKTSMMCKKWFRNSQMKLANPFILFFCCPRVAITYLKRQLHLLLFKIFQTF